MQTWKGRCGDQGHILASLEIEEFEIFYAENKQGVYAYLVAGLRDPDLAEDVFQEAFLKMLSQVKAGRIQSATARAYIYRIARNAMIDAIRARSKTSELAEPEKILYESQTDEAERIRLLFMEALAELPNDMALLLEMRLMKQMPVEEICKHFEASRATLYRRLEQGMKTVAAYFQKAGYDPEVLES